MPGAGDSDTFVTVGLDVNDHRNPDHVTSRGYGIGQFTLFHHPPTASEVNTFIMEPAANVAQAVKELREKFDHDVIGPSSVADDRIQEGRKRTHRTPVNLTLRIPITYATV